MLAKQNDDSKQDTRKLQEDVQKQLQDAAATAKMIGALQQECAFLIRIERSFDQAGEPTRARLFDRCKSLVQSEKENTERLENALLRSADQLRKRDEDFLRLSKQHESLITSHAETTRREQAALRYIEELCEELRAAREKTQSLEQQKLAEADEREKAHRQALDMCESWMNGAQSELDRLRHKLEELSGLTKAEANQLRVDLEAALANVAAAKQELADLKSLKDRTDKANDVLVAQLRNEIRELQGELAKRVRESDYDELRKKLAASEKENAVMTKELEMLRKQVDQAANAVSVLNGALKRQEVESNKLQVDLTAAHKDREAKVKQLSDAEAEFSKARKKISEAEQDLATLRSELSTLHAAFTSTEKQNGSMTKELEMLHKQLSEADAMRSTISDLKEQLGQARHSVAEAKADTKSANLLLSEAQAQMQSLRASSLENLRQQRQV